MDVSYYNKKNTVTREYLANAIKKETGISINKSAELVGSLFHKMIEELKLRHMLKIRLFGVFSIKHKKARVGRNPKNLKEALIPERDIIKFKIAPTLKKRINSNIGQIG
jgi:integration host factor subunit alpha